jgi:hypothetical protein
MRIRLAASVAIATTASVLVTLPATASSSGVVLVGSTVTATAWERGGLDNFKYDLPIDPGDPSSPVLEVIPESGFEEYVYRVYDGSTSVDVQSTEGYEGLTEAEQNQWYVDAGYAPYDFTWLAFACLGAYDQDATDILPSEEITLTEMHYVAADVRYPTNDRLYSDDYLGDFQPSLNDGSVFGVDEFVSSHMSVTGYPGVYVWPDGVQAMGDMAFSASYPEFACAGESELVGFRILNSSDISDPATERDLEITETLHVDVFGEPRELESDGAFIGVTGGIISIEYNAALWGMTQVGGDLANTGTDATGIAMLGGGFAIVGALAAAARVSRRRA